MFTIGFIVVCILLALTFSIPVEQIDRNSGNDIYDL